MSELISKYACHFSHSRGISDQLRRKEITTNRFTCCWMLRKMSILVICRSFQSISWRLKKYSPRISDLLRRKGITTDILLVAGCEGTNVNDANIGCVRTGVRSEYPILFPVSSLCQVLPNLLLVICSSTTVWCVMAPPLPAVDKNRARRQTRNRMEFYILHNA